MSHFSAVLQLTPTFERVREALLPKALTAKDNSTDAVWSLVKRLALFYLTGVMLEASQEFPFTYILAHLNVHVRVSYNLASKSLCGNFLQTDFLTEPQSQEYSCSQD